MPLEVTAAGADPALLDPPWSGPLEDWPADRPAALPRGICRHEEAPSQGRIRRPGLAGALALIGAVTALLVAAVFTVQMAVDGVALTGAIDAWAAAFGPDKVAAFQMADDIRWVEKGLGGFFQVLNGLTLLALGLSVAFGHAFARWLGWMGAAAGIGWVTGGTITAHTGFSSQASTVLLAASALTAVFLVGESVSMWRRSSVAG